MSYTRVIPRDFYNESKLLKCMGHLDVMAKSSKCPSGIEIIIEENGEPFNIHKDESSGNIYISNYMCYVNQKLVRFETNLNSKSNYPLSCMFEYTPYMVFDEQGDFDSEFIEAFTKPAE
jgi:hypothetical protein